MHIMVNEKHIVMKRIVMYIIFLCHGISVFPQLNFKKYEQCTEFQEITMEIISDTTLMIITDLNCTHCVDYPTHVEIYCEYRIQGDSLYIGKTNPLPERYSVMFHCNRTKEYAMAGVLEGNLMARKHLFACVLPNLENAIFIIVTIEKEQLLYARIAGNLGYAFMGVNDE